MRHVAHLPRMSCFVRPFCPRYDRRGLHFLNAAGLYAVYVGYFILMNTSCNISIPATMKKSLITNEDAALFNEDCCPLPIVAPCARLLRVLSIHFSKPHVPILPSSVFCKCISVSGCKNFAFMTDRKALITMSAARKLPKKRHF